MPFETYVKRIMENPKAAALAHERVYNMIMSHGVDDEGRFEFFKHDLFGLDEAIKNVVDYFKSAAQRMETRKRILLLRGPVSSAKSTLVDMLKKGVEDYSRTPEGALYGIAGCPLREEPLHLIPHDIRPLFWEEHHVYIEGDLCPMCRHRLEHEFRGDRTKFQVERLVVSEKARRGIGTFLPSDPKSQDMSELVGSVNFAKIGTYGMESHPEAYTFDGEINVANRGIMEFIEMLKADEKFLYVLLTLTQEQVLKAPRFPRIYTDVVILAHTNESEYNEFVSDPRSEALQDRLIVVDFPYTMKVSEEVKIYRKLLRDTKTKKHVSPHSLEAAAMFAVLSRLADTEDPKLDRVKKMRLYNGEHVDKYSPADVAALRGKSPREGMSGVSPRYIVNRVAHALIQEDEACLTPTKVLRWLREGLPTHAKFSDEERRDYVNLIALVAREYERIAEESVRRAVVHGFEAQCEELFQTYLSHLEAYVNKSRLVAHDDEPVPVDEGLLRSVERRLGIQEAGKDAYRRQILAKVNAVSSRGDVFTYKTDDPLRRAIEDVVYEQNKNHLKAITTVKTPSPDLQRKVDAAVERLVAEHGYCRTCATDLLRFVGQVYSKADAEKHE